MRTAVTLTSRWHRVTLRYRRLVFVGVAIVATFHTSCRSTKRYEIIEAELRTRERELNEARGELQNAKSLNNAYARTPRYGPEMDNGAGAPTLPLKEIVLGTGTGGADNDDRPGDEALQIVLVPRDDDGSSVKVPGRAEVSAFEIARSGVKTAIGRWEVPPEQLRRTWRGGLFATGYYVPLLWDQLPGTERLRIAVRFVTLDGRTFEADKDITVRPVPGAVPQPQSGEVLPFPGGFADPFPAAPPSAIPSPGIPLPPPNLGGNTELPLPSGYETRRPSVRLLPAKPNDRQ